MRYEFKIGEGIVNTTAQDLEAKLMELIPAKKLVIITETVIEEKIIKIIEEHGVKRYTLYRNIADKSEHGIRAGSGGLSIIEDDFKIEIIVPDEEKARAIMEKIITKHFFSNYESSMYLEDVKIPQPSSR